MRYSSIFGIISDEQYRSRLVTACKNRKIKGIKKEATIEELEQKLEEFVNEKEE